MPPRDIAPSSSPSPPLPLGPRPDSGIASAIETIDLQNNTTEPGIDDPPGQGDANDIAIDEPDDHLFVPESGSGTVAMLNLTTGGLVADLNGGPGPNFAVFDPDVDRALVTSGTELRFYNGATGGYDGEIALGREGEQLAFDPSTGTVFVALAGAPGALVEISPSLGGVEANVTLGVNPNFVSYDPVTEDVIVGDYGDEDLWSVNATTMKVDGLAKDYSPMAGITCDTLNGWIYVAVDQGAGVPNWIEALNRSVNRSWQEFSPQYMVPGGLTFDPSNQVVYATDTGHSAVYPINASTRTLGPLIRLEGGGPDAIAYAAGTDSIFVAETYSLAIARVNVTAASQSATFYLAISPSSLSLDPLTSQLAVFGYPPSEGIVETTGDGAWEPFACPPSGVGTFVSLVEPRVEVVGAGPLFCTLNDSTQAVLSDQTSPAGSNVSHLATDPNGSVLFEGAYIPGSPNAGVIFVWDPSNWTVEESFVLGSGAAPSALLYDPYSGLLFVTECHAGTVAAIRISSGAFVRNDSIGGCPGDMTYDPQNGDVYAYDLGADIAVLNGTNASVVTGATFVPEGSGGIAYDDGYVYFADSGSGEVYALDPSTNAYSAVSSGSDPIDVAADPSSDLVYVLNLGFANNGGTITVLSPCGDSCLDATGFAATPSEVAEGDPVTLTTTVTGGFAPYSVALSGGPAGCPTSFTTSETCSPTSIGTYRLVAHVHDTAGNTVVRETVVTVVDQLTVSAWNLSANATDIGRPVTLMAVAAHGEAPLTWTYSDLPPGCPPQDLQNLTCDPTAAGSFVIRLTVTDPDGHRASDAIGLQVNGRLGVTARISPSSVGVGGAFNLTVSATGGTSPYVVALALGAGAECPASVNLTPVTCRATGVGPVAIEASVTDAVGATENASATVTVVAATHPVGPTNGGSPLGPIDWEIAAGAAIAIGALAVLLVIRGRRARS